MARFLNTDKLNEWIPRLIQESERELIILVPYIKASARTFSFIEAAIKRGVEITIVYREDKLSAQEHARFEALDNLNLMHHPNIHAKCYYNEKFLIVTSMNLYEYSERNNREMGVLLHREDLDSEGWGDADPEIIFKDAIAEIRSILNGATMQKKSRETLEEGFEMDIIKTERERTLELCAFLNKVFVHKRFEPVKNDSGGVFSSARGDYSAVCYNYFDRIDVIYDYRIELRLNYDESRIEEIFNRFKPHYDEYMFPGFKFYWNHPKGSIYLYKDSRHRLWQEEKTEMEKKEQVRQGIDALVGFLRRFL